jgi:hypothetical protein
MLSHQPLILNVSMLSVIMLNVIMLNIVMLNVVMLSVVAPPGLIEQYILDTNA